MTNVPQDPMHLNVNIPIDRWGSVHVAEDVPEHLDDRGALGYEIRILSD
ncbi:MAG TPA: hypothetical protein VMW06_02725 [Desulfobacterales bacterium]|nr:hypothetical protein [Desulfobacterales bacterium]